ncbi:MAG: hypothetical protein AAF226_15845 [Verrucomicrobiota bacterium]
METGEIWRPAHEAWYYWGGNKLQAVRKGPWKLALTGQSIGMGFKEQPEDIRKSGRLYHLGKDIGEMDDVAEQNPEIVAELEALAKAKSDELLANVRPIGRVEDPVMLYPSDAEPRGLSSKSKTKQPVKSLDLSDAKSGDVIATASVPNVSKRPFELSVKISGNAPRGVILSHGGSAVGYALWVKAGELNFVLRNGEKVERMILPLGPLEEPIQVSVGKKEMVLKHGEAEVRQPAVMVGRHPSEDMSIGFDVANPVDNDAPKKPFNGDIRDIQLK